MKDQRNATQEGPDPTLLALKREEGAVSQGMQVAHRTEKSKETYSLLKLLEMKNTKAISSIKIFSDLF